MARTLLLISTNSDDQTFAEEVSACSGLELEVVAKAEDAGEVIAEETSPLLMPSISTEGGYLAFEKVIQETVGLLSDRVNANSIHFISSENLEDLPFLVQSPLFGHFISRRYHNPKEAGRHYGRLVGATLEERAFGLGHLFKSQAKIQEIKLQHSNQKQDAVEAVRNYLLAMKFQSRMATVIGTAVDELLMNAMYDAPVDNLGRQIYESLSRATPLKLEGKSAVEMHVGYDGDYVGITAVDYFGSLDKTRLLSHISKVYTEEEYKVKTSVAGAGLGLATVYKSGGSFLFASESHAKTEVTVFFKRTNNFRDFKDQFRFLSTQFYF